MAKMANFNYEIAAGMGRAFSKYKKYIFVVINNTILMSISSCKPVKI